MAAKRPLPFANESARYLKTISNESRSRVLLGILFS